MSPKAMSRILGVLATERRIQIMRVLLDSDEPVPSSVVGGIVGMDDGPTSFNLTKLAEVGLVTRNASGRWVFYSANRVVMEEVQKFWSKSDGNG